MRNDRMTRRSLLGGVASTVLAGIAPASARPLPMRRGGRGGGSGTPLALTLAFADGNTLSFSQTAATDVGDYVGTFVHQKCYRQRITTNGDYRDAFTVFFRPDADGARDEVVVEFGTQYSFTTTPPTVSGGTAIVNMFVPPQPTVTATTGGTSGQSGVLTVIKTYVGPSGESIGSARRNITLAVGDLATSPSPAAAGGATHYNVYAQFNVAGGNQLRLQSVSPIAIGTDWTEPTTGILTTGPTEPLDATMVAYTATITGGNLVSPVVVSIHSHWWAARWRWQSAQRPLVRSYSDLVTLKAAWPLDASLTYSAPLPPASTWAPFGSGGFAWDMASTGGRPELAILTEWVAAWALTGNASMETSWRAHAEAPGTMSIWIRDAATGALVDAIAHPYVCFNDATFGPYQIPRPPVPSTSAHFFKLDGAHVGEASFIPWMLTDDPYFLENAQALALYGILNSNLTAQNQVPKIPGLAYVAGGQTRGFAWNIRDITHLADFAPVSPPSFFLPRSFFTSSLSNTRGYAQKFLDSTTPQTTGVFHLITETGFGSPFMVSYLNIVLSQIMWTGRHSDWDDVALYAATFRLAISDVDDAYGWDHRLAVPYNYPSYNAKLGAGSFITNGGHSTAPGPNTPTSWAEAFSYVPDIYGLPEPTTWALDELYDNNQKGYWLWVRAELAAMSQAGIPKAKTNYDWFKAAVERYPLSAISAGRGYAWAIPPL